MQIFKILSRSKAFLILAAASFLTHLPGITNPILDHHAWAQTLRASLSRNYVEDGMNLMKPRYDYIETAGHNKSPQFPLYSYLAALLYKVFGIHDFLGRVLSAIFAAWAAVFLYLLAARFLEDRTAFLSSLVFCVIPIRIYFMRAFMPEAMAIFCLLAGFYFFIRWLDDDRDRFWPFGLAASFLLALVPLLKIAYLWILLAPAFYVLKKRGAGFLKNWGFLLFSTIFIFMVGGWYARINLGAERTKGFLEQLTNEMSIVKEWMDPRFWSIHFLSRFPELLTTYAGLVFFFVGLWKIWKEKISFPLLWFVSTVFYILLCGSYGRIHQYVSLPFAPVNAVFMAVGMVFLWDRWKNRKALAALWILLTLSMPVHAALRIRHWYEPDQVWVLRAQKVVEQISSPEDLFFIASPNQPFYLYYIRRRGWTVPLEGEGQKFLEEALKKGAKFLFIPSGDPWVDFEVIRAWAGKNFPKVADDPEFAIYDLTHR